MIIQLFNYANFPFWGRWRLQRLKIQLSQNLMKLVLNERYDILVYVFHSYFWLLLSDPLWGTMATHWGTFSDYILGWPTFGAPWGILSNVLTSEIMTFYFMYSIFIFGLWVWYRLLEADGGQKFNFLRFWWN